MLVSDHCTPKGGQLVLGTSCLLFFKEMHMQYVQWGLAAFLVALVVWSMFSRPWKA